MATAATAAARKSKRRVLTDEKVDAVLRHDFPGYWLALNHHRTHKNQRFDLAAYSYLRAPLFDDAQVIVAKKATQGGWTEMLIAKALGQLERAPLGIFWVLPTGVIKNRFVKNRFDRSVAYTEHYRELMRGEETRFSGTDRAASMSLKHYAGGSLAFVGSNAMAGFGEFPADIGVVDEYDYCEQDNMPMVEERLSNSELRMRWYSSQPSIAGRGISALYKDSNQQRWLLRAACGHVVRPEWGKHVVRKIDEARYEVLDPEWSGLDGPDARMICDRCGKPVDRTASGFWEAENPRHPVHGYHFSKLFSTRMTMNEMLARFDKGLTNPVEQQRFENADMGEEHSARGSKIQLEDLETCVGDYGQGRCAGSVVVGVDVGAVLHVAVGELMQDGCVRVMWLGTLAGDANNLDDLRLLVRGYRFLFGVIDELPETRMSRRLAYSSRHWWMCRYAHGKRDMPDPRAKMISVDRTSALDAVNEAVMIGPERLKLPADALGVEGFADQMLELTRVYDPELNGGEGGYVWDGDGPDHFMHALGYMLLARRMVVRR